MQLGEIYNREKELHDVPVVILEHARLEDFSAHGTPPRATLLRHLLSALSSFHSRASLSVHLATRSRFAAGVTRVIRNRDLPLSPEPLATVINHLSSPPGWTGGAGVCLGNLGTVAG